MTKSSPKLIVKELVLVGHEKNYSVPFSSGLNIIYGDSDTGKSSIINLIDYLLGASKLFLYEEIERHGKYGLLEVSLNNTIYTIKRDIFSPEELIEVFQSPIEEINSVFPQLYGPNYSKEGPAGFLSDFLLKALNIPQVKVKKAPSKAGSDMNRLSFRDIFKYCYLDQDDVGSRDILDRKNYTLIAKNKETFKFLHNLLDDQVTQLQEDISEKVKERNTLTNNFKVISSFLGETQLDTEDVLHGNLYDLSQQLAGLEIRIEKITASMKSNDKETEVMRDVILRLGNNIQQLMQQKFSITSQMEQNLRLRAEYEKDIIKIRTSIETMKKLPDMQNVPCPVCKNEIKSTNVQNLLKSSSEQTLQAELKSVRNRTKELNKLIDEQRHDLFELDKDAQELRQKLDKLNHDFNVTTEAFVSPFIAERDRLVSNRAAIKEQHSKVEYLLKIRKQLNEMTKKSDIIGEQIKELNATLDVLKAASPSVEQLISDIGDYLRGFLSEIPIKNNYGVSINSTSFLPVVRNRDYVDLTSGGLRTLVSIGYFTSVFSNSLRTTTYLPSLLMMDTVGKYLGKTQPKYMGDTDSKEDKKEGLDDPSKYINIYKYLSRMSESFLEQGKDHQVIVVDNDIPPELEEQLSRYVVKRFSDDDKEGFERGFIDNAIL